MPYKSEKQRKYLHSQKPEVAARFDKDIKAGKKSDGSKSPSRKGPSSAGSPKPVKKGKKK